MAIIRCAKAIIKCLQFIKEKAKISTHYFNTNKEDTREREGEKTEKDNAGKIV